jgi:hypothetical protein
VDPNVTLKKLRAICAEYEAEQKRNIPFDNTETAVDMVTEFYEYFKALDEWLMLGGFKPAVWSCREPQFVAVEARAFPPEAPDLEECTAEEGEIVRTVVRGVVGKPITQYGLQYLAFKAQLALAPVQPGRVPVVGCSFIKGEIKWWAGWALPKSTGESKPR